MLANAIQPEYSYRQQRTIHVCLRPSLTFLCLLLVSTAGGSAQDIFVTPVPGAPFSGIVNVERSVIQPDGSVVSLKTMREIGRDSRGRIHNESRALLPAANATSPTLLRIHLYDPQTRTSTMLDPQQRTFWTTTVNRPPSTVPPGLLDASPAGDNLPSNEFAKKQDLGVQDVDGVAVHGVRETQTIAAEKEIVVTDEYWYSDELRMNLVIKHSDPRTGTVKMTVNQITRTEPSPTFFEIPDGYKPAKGTSISSYPGGSGGGSR
jgi:hypothetical protein